MKQVYSFSFASRAVANAWRWRTALSIVLLTGLPGAGLAQTFAPAAVLTAGSIYPLGITVGDFNGDGQLDLSTANATSNVAAVYLGDGAGGFQYPTTYSTGPNSYPNKVAVGDVNGDGKNDLVTSNHYSNGVGVLLGNGNGTLQAPTVYSSGGNVVGVVLRDVNADNNLDIITSNYNTSTVAVLLGNGNGTFQTRTTFSTGTSSFPFSPALADVNGDGKLDIITPNTYNSTVGVLLGNGNGTFQTVATFNLSVGSEPYEVVVGDVNGDGFPDLATANRSANTVGILLGNGNGTFQTVTNYGAGANSQPNGLVMADLNGDGNLDIATANYGISAVSILAGSGNGAFSVSSTFSMGTNSEPAALAVGDANGDGRPDLFSANYGNTTVGILLNTTAPQLIRLSTTSAVPGTSISLVGTGLGKATAVRFGSMPAAFSINSTTSITAVVPVGAAAGNVTVITPAGTTNGLGFSPQPALVTTPAVLAQQVALYPNPATGSVSVELPAILGRQAVNMALVDALGHQLRTVSLPARSSLAYQLDLRELPSGVYALHLTTGVGTLVKKLVVK